MLNKKDFDLLEKIFAEEIGGTLPFQSKSKEYKRLEAEGLVLYDSEIKGHDRFGAIRVSGWYLTHTGRYEYCKACDKYGEKEEE